MTHALHHGTGYACACGQLTQRWTLRDTLMRAIEPIARTVKRWNDRSRQRQALQYLDDHLLKDIGLVRAAAMKEAAKPFWM